jgi:hypothetical protein
MWLAGESNHFLARATVNRVWWLLFGRGLVEPVDDLSPANAPSHPRILELLAEFLVESGYDLRELFRAVALTQAYGLSSRTTASGPSPAADLFAVMPLKCLTPEQIFDSLVQAAYNSPQLSVDNQVPTSLANSIRQQFLANMGADVHQPLEYSAGLQQTLLLINGPQINKLLADPEHGLLAALSAPFLDHTLRVEGLVLSVLGRLPSASEQTAFVAHLNAAKDNAEQTAAMADIFWVLVNSAEFRLNH